MRVYAAYSGGADDQEHLVAVRYPHVLIAFTQRRNANLLRAAYRPHLILDSGAFSVWSIGETIDLETYADWAAGYCHLAPGTLVANLDVIPGRPGEAPTPDEVDRAVRQGMENADYLRARGLPIVEAYHRGEPLSVLEALYERRRPGDILAFGGLVGGRDFPAKIEFVQKAFARLGDLIGDVRKVVPVHGFGIGPLTRLARCAPWYSIDATSWLLARRFATELGQHGRTNGKMTAGLSKLYLSRTLRHWQELEVEHTARWAHLEFVDLPAAAVAA